MQSNTGPAELGCSHASAWVEHLISQAGWNDVIFLSCLALSQDLCFVCKVRRALVVTRLGREPVFHMLPANVPHGLATRGVHFPRAWNAWENLCPWASN